MSIVQSSKGREQLLLDGYRYRRANHSQVTWTCTRNNCAGRVTSNGTEYVTLTEHSHAPSPEESASIEFK